MSSKEAKDLLFAAGAVARAFGLGIVERQSVWRPSGPEPHPAGALRFVPESGERRYRQHGSPSKLSGDASHMCAGFVNPALACDGCSLLASGRKKLHVLSIPFDVGPVVRDSSVIRDT
uniref:Uncharacterized protein n=1 Tax=Odontella aurita TaxID=265563 RepID=A0A7S4K4I9_9STRA